MRTVNLTGASQQVGPNASPFLYYRGFSVRETGGATALLRIWDSTATLGATGTILDEVSLIANQSRGENYGTAKPAKVGIYVQVVSGAVAGSVNLD